MLSTCPHPSPHQRTHPPTFEILCTPLLLFTSLSFNPSHYSLTLSSAMRLLSCILSWNLKKLLVPIGCSLNNRQRAINWPRLRLSNVNSSSKSLENFMISALLACFPDLRIFRKKLRDNLKTHHGWVGIMSVSLTVNNETINRMMCYE